MSLNYVLSEFQEMFCDFMFSLFPGNNNFQLFQMQLKLKMMTFSGGIEIEHWV